LRRVSVRKAKRHGPWTYIRTLADFTVPNDRGESHLAIDVAADLIAVSAVDRASAFERTATGWTETQLPRPAGAASGCDVAATDNLVVIGGTFNGRLAGFIYRRNAPGQWAFETRVLAGLQPVADNDYLGERVDADAGYVVIGNPDSGEDPNVSGKLYVFRRGEEGL
jgi:hypothetical protein